MMLIGRYGGHSWQYWFWGVRSWQYSFVHLVFLVCFSGSSSTSSLSGDSLLLPLSVSTSETDILLGSTASSSGSSTFLCLFFFLLRGLPLSSPCWESCSILLGCPSGYKGS